MTPETEPTEWDFYLCQVDDALAMISLNLAWHRSPRPKAADTVYYAWVPMTSPGHHGAGTAEEQERFSPVEDTFAQEAARLGLFYVSRMRNNSAWQLTFYGPPGLSDGFASLAGRFGASDTGAQEDNDWEYYFNFLSPDEERWAWIMDRRVVDQLASHGDLLETPRQVDHVVVCPTRSSADRFAAVISGAGFHIESVVKDPDGGQFVVQFHRQDPVFLDHINAVAGQLRLQAQEAGGGYDGWGCQVVTP